MFAQLLVYVRAARKRGEPIPGFLAVIDRQKTAIMPTDMALPILEDASVVWPKSGSAAGKELAAQVAVRMIIPQGRLCRAGCQAQYLLGFLPA